MSHDLTSIKIATLIAAGPKQEEVLDSQKLLHQAGATVTMVSAAGNLPEIRKAGKPLAVVALESADETGFDALFVPSGEAGADDLSRSPAAVKFVRSFLAASKPTGAVADGVKVLMSADGVAGRHLAADPRLRDSIEKAGGVWIDKPIATDRDLVTAADIQSMEPFLEAFALSCTQHKASSGASLHTD